MLATEPVQLTDDIGHLHLLAVDCSRNTLLEVYSYIFSLIWCLLRICTKYKKVIPVWLQRWIFKLQTFVADVPDVTVTAVRCCHIKWKINAVLLTECDFILTGLHRPLWLSPCCDDI